MCHMSGTKAGTCDWLTLHRSQMGKLRPMWWYVFYIQVEMGIKVVWARQSMSAHIVTVAAHSLFPPPLPLNCVINDYKLRNTGKCHVFILHRSSKAKDSYFSTVCTL